MRTDVHAMNALKFFGFTATLLVLYVLQPPEKFRQDLVMLTVLMGGIFVLSLPAVRPSVTRRSAVIAGLVLTLIAVTYLYVRVIR